MTFSKSTPGAVSMLTPFPFAAVRDVLLRYDAAREAVSAREEPRS